MTDAIKLAIEALEDLIESVTGVDQVSAVNQARTALAALRAQPADPFKKLSDAQVLWLAESHGIDVYASNPLAFYADLISTTPAQPDHSEKHLEMVAAARAVVERWDSPLWKDVPATAVYINRLRDALPDSDHETATGRALYTVTALRKAYDAGFEDALGKQGYCVCVEGVHIPDDVVKKAVFLYMTRDMK